MEILVIKISIISKSCLIKLKPPTIFPDINRSGTWNFINLTLIVNQVKRSSDYIVLECIKVYNLDLTSNVNSKAEEV